MSNNTPASQKYFFLIILPILFKAASYRGGVFLATYEESFHKNYYTGVVVFLRTEKAVLNLP